MPDVRNVSLGGGQIAMLQTVTQLSAAQIQALQTTPITIVPAPGAGKMIVPFSVAYSYHFGSHAFITQGADGLNVEYNGGAFDTINSLVTGLIVAAQSAFATNPVTYGGPNLISPGEDNTGLILVAQSNYNAGPILTTTLGAGGTGYVANDTGTITNGNNDATYKVLTVGAGGAVLTYQITGAGTKCSVANGNATVDGGAQPGVGVGFTVNITAVQTGDGTLKVVTYYQIIPVP